VLAGRGAAGERGGHRRIMARCREIEGAGGSASPNWAGAPPRTVGKG